eukprot:CAMPEP_0174275858 /NCGR_PEP_ID=MMETSP0439-20130205/60068_1 /TAXON_ID=0 /ORGANISM="Stereomyxa ramosa, Strain Chinc5" /LENGTH=227 /DNA_ID=CAMNT_0015368029 /DNA_START=539 /DNA_END=1219 /DNA_ORIENTATION=-
MDEKKKNFRDVGQALREVWEQHTTEMIPLNKLFRSGLIDYCSIPELGNTRTIVNLRMAADDQNCIVWDESESLKDEVQFKHFPIENCYEKYHTHETEVKKWLVQVVKLFEDENTKYPVLIHCRAGKDRTGVVVATLLAILGIPEEIIVEEFMLSEEAPLDKIHISLDGFRKPLTKQQRLQRQKKKAPKKQNKRKVKNRKGQKGAVQDAEQIEVVVDAEEKPPIDMEW